MSKLRKPLTCNCGRLKLLNTNENTGTGAFSADEF